jgi:hypothetical protein
MSSTQFAFFLTGAASQRDGRRRAAVADSQLGYKSSWLSSPSFSPRVTSHFFSFSLALCFQASSPSPLPSAEAGLPLTSCSGRAFPQLTMHRSPLRSHEGHRPPLLLPPVLHRAGTGAARVRPHLTVARPTPVISRSRTTTNGFALAPSCSPCGRASEPGSCLPPARLARAAELELLCSAVSLRLFL